MKFLKAYFVSLFYYIFLFSLLLIIQHGMKEIIAMIVYQLIYVTPMVLLLSGILESYLKTNDNKLVVVFIGFLYGLAISIIFDGTTSGTDVFVYILPGCIFSIGALIFTIIRGKVEVH
ncbi:hypothetical protein NC661_19420 [Aquibacillus koreensis]|uniref:Uncharacterized protein n=1 Tax=Aquibacillus koreensis TaxID=279446 RepID=A0A9X3WQP5_9BACI|nr:hypothetical protein [Aquibacillus koreensis]MCT2535361.1 hypothetical protein [Aquibacillus koreensis]MDC3422526.1 hypothetical protein [Aquibacillus koreensis]